MACTFGILELVRLLLSRERLYVFGSWSLVAQKDGPGGTPLVHAIRGDWGDVVQLLLDHRANANGGGDYWTNPLLEAVNMGNKASARLLLEYGADVNVGARWGFTPLTQAVGSSREVSLVRVLLEHGAETGLRDPEGYTALRRAIIMEQVATVRLLLDYGADVNEEYDEGIPTLFSLTTLSLAIFSQATLIQVTFSLASNTAILRLLLERGANVHGSAGQKALALAIDTRNTAAARVLLEWGTKLGMLVGRPWALVEAAEEGDAEMVRHLIENGADVNILFCGKTALQEARKGGHAEVMHLLEAAGAHAGEGALGATSACITGGPCDTIRQVRRLLLGTKIDEGSDRGAATPHLMRDRAG